MGRGWAPRSDDTRRMDEGKWPYRPSRVGKGAVNATATLNGHGRGTGAHASQGGTAWALCCAVLVVSWVLLARTFAHPTTRRIVATRQHVNDSLTERYQHRHKWIRRLTVRSALWNLHVPR